ncbi:MAG TPA: XRE family transcriptional regulator [Moorella mulderi]|nr:XRE family transcriptional regulator [Moorella mulderi]
MASLGERLAALRRAKGLTQAEIAKKLNMGQSTIAMYEKNRRTPDAQTLRRLADFFEVSVDYLLGRMDPYPLPEELQKVSAWESKDSLPWDTYLTLLEERLKLLSPEERRRALQHLKGDYPEV